MESVKLDIIIDKLSIIIDHLDSLTWRERLATAAAAENIQRSYLSLIHI